MKKYVFNIVYLTSLTLSVFSIHEAMADRGPSVEPFVEVDIENAKNVDKKPAAFDFAHSDSKNAAQFNRKPAGIVAKDGATSPMTYLGPIIFLLALPFAIWMVISRKVSDNPVEDKVDYYPKTFQFKPYKTEYQKSDDEDDIDYPKAS